MRALYNRRNSRNQAAPLPLFVGPDAGNGNLLDTISIDITNPFNPFGTTARRRSDGTADSHLAFIGRRVVENGPRRYDQSVDTFYVAGTLDGDVQMFDNDWYWDVNLLWGKNEAEQTVHGNINAANLARALGPVAACTAPCVPFNIFGGTGSITQPMLDYVAFTQVDSSEQELWDVSATISGSLFELPGGPAGLALGVEHRDQSGRFDPDPIVAAGLGSDIPALPTSGDYNVDEIYRRIAVAAARQYGLLPPPRADRRRPLFRLFDLGFDDDVQRGTQLGTDRGPAVPRQLGGGLPRTEHRRIVRHAVALRPGGSRSLLGLLMRHH